MNTKNLEETHSTQTVSTLRPFIAETAQELYFQALEALSEGEETPSTQDPRSIGSAWGHRQRPTKELRYQTLVLLNPRARLVDTSLFRLEDILPRTILATLSDELSADALAFYNPKAFEFSDDGETIPSNYGYRARHLYNVNQIDQVISQLKQDPYSRRAVIHIHTTDDYKRKYCPCIDSLHFLIRNGALECQSFWRSENAFTLLPTNLFEFTMLQELIASELGVSLGIYVHTVSSLHYYLEDQARFDLVLDTLASSSAPGQMDPMTAHSLNQIALLRKFEHTVRKGLGDSLETLSQLSPYWQQIAFILAYSIAQKTNNFAAAKSWGQKSEWRDMLS